MRPWSFVPFAAALAALAAAPTPARAQEAPLEPEGLALNRFVPAPAGDRLFSVPSAFSAGHLTPHVMLMADYASNPLVLRRERDGADLGAVVSDQLTFRLNASLPLWNKVVFNLDAPLTALQSGESPSGGGRAFASPSGAELGDLRLGARVQLYGAYHDPLQVAVGAYLWLPTGADDSFVSDGSVRGMPFVVAGGRIERLVWSAAVGAELRRSQSFGGVAQGTMLTLGGGVGFLAADDRLQVGPELSTAMVLEDVSDRSINAELLVGARYRFLPFMEAGLGVGPGLTSGIGTPDLRVVAMVGFTPEQPPPAPDRDGDGIADVVDACPQVAGVRSDDPKKNGCPPPPDRDNDGILDADDACPLEPGVRSDDPKKNGCPPPLDRDNDGILDAVDACPLAAGLPSDDPTKHGCPPDTDGDTFRDDTDACPREKGHANPDPQKHGCPKAVRVTEKQVVILQQVQFDTDKATIKPESDPLLDEVAQVLLEHPEIILIEIQGHTDDRGTDEHNRVLSQNRANSVLAALVRRGIDSTRLTAQGYGRDQPLDNNATDEGRQRNRRVQFNIIKKAAYKPQAGTGENR
ncbi:OmpA family protein [Sorangium sp. So ce131]|uniref:OmpA family protein n=1 Tax=Sorangium sp. So ce131 TaxID=3133282 RepID=UPI003F5D9A21